MTALTENKEVVEKGRDLLAFQVVASDIVYKGALVKTNAAGYLAPMAAEAAAFFAGIAYEKADNSAGSAGDIVCQVMRKGVFPFVTSGMAIDDMQKIVYASDDQTVSLVQGANELAIGRIVEVISATSVMVDINVY